MLQTRSLPRNFRMSNQRLASSSSRTTRVIEELQDSLESIQKDIANTKTQVGGKRKKVIKEYSNTIIYI